MFIDNVHYSGVHSVVLTSDDEVCVCVRLCVCACMYVSPLKFLVQAAAQKHLLEALRDRDNLSYKP